MMWKQERMKSSFYTSVIIKVSLRENLLNTSLHAVKHPFQGYHGYEKIHLLETVILLGSNSQEVFQALTRGVDRGRAGIVTVDLYFEGNIYHFSTVPSPTNYSTKT